MPKFAVVFRDDLAVCVSRVEAASAAAAEVLVLCLEMAREAKHEPANSPC